MAAERYVDDEAANWPIDHPRSSSTGDRLVCADNADADDLRQAADIVESRANLHGLADRLRNLAYAAEYRAAHPSRRDR